MDLSTSLPVTLTSDINYSLKTRGLWWCTKASVAVRCSFLFELSLHPSRKKQNPMASLADYAVIVVIVADSILTGWLCNVTGMSQRKHYSIWRWSFEAMTSPSSLSSLINLVVEVSCSWPLCWKGFLHLLYSLKKTLSFSVSVVRFSFLSPSVPSPLPPLALYSAETHYLGNRTGKCTCVQC